jgi:hypothetical protein
MPALAGDFQDAVVGAGAQIQVRHGELQQLDSGFVEPAIDFQML